MNKYFFLVLAIFFANVYLNAQCTISAGDDKTVCIGATTTLTATGGVSYLWNTGATTASIEVTPNETTTYEVSVTCEDTQVLVDETTVFVNPLPIVDLGTDKALCIGDSTDLIITGGYAYYWSTGETTNQITVTPTITSDYWVILTDANNCQNEDTVTVIVNPLPTITVCADQEICLQDSILLTSTSEAEDYLWNTGDETSAIWVSPVVTSTYIVEVTDENQCSNTANITVVVNSLPIANFEFTEVCQEFITAFVDVSYDPVNTITAWSWDFKDDSVSSEQNPEYIFSTSGVYDVEFVVTSNKNCNDTIIRSVEVYTKPQASFSQNIDTSCNSPVVVNFIDESTSAQYYLWSFGNGEESNEHYPNTMYNEIGEYETSLIITSEHDCKDTAYSQFVIFQKPVISFSTDNQTGCEPLQINFSHSTLYADSIAWIYNGKISNEDTFFDDIYQEGTYSLSFYAYNNNGCDARIDKDNYFTVYNKPVPDFSFEEEIDPFPYGMIYFGNYSLGATDYIWSFGDSIVSSDKDPIHRYDTNGTFSVKLIAIDLNSGCVDSIVYDVDVEYFDGLYVPNAFMPETGIGDSKYFLPKGKHLITYHVKVFNKWGNLLWESESLNFGSPAEFWDGKYNGKLMPQGVYLWQITAEFENGITWKGQKQDSNTYKTTGSLNLIR